MHTISEYLISGNIWHPLLSGKAYLDPGSGSFILQLLIAGFVGFIFVVRTQWAKIKSMFKRSKTGQEAKQDLSDDE
jgi:hypothetical protein